MKKAQAILEYFILSAVLLFIAITVLWSFNFANLAPISVFGIKTNNNTVTIPAMTP